MKAKTIDIFIEGEKKTVSKYSYIKAKTKQLKEFGYTTLTEDQTAKALEKAINGESAGDVISMFIASDLNK